MNVPFALELVVGIVLGITIITIVMFVLQLRAEKQFNRLSQPAYEYMQQQAAKQADDVVAAAKETAFAIEAEASKERETLLRDFQSELAAMKGTYKEALEAAVQEQRAALQSIQKAHADELATQTTAAIKTVTDTITPLQTDVASLQERLTDVQNTIVTTAKTTETTFASKVEAAVHAVQSALTDEQAAVVATIQEQATTATAGIEEAMQAYQKEREHIVDMHITQLVEAVAKQVLHAELTVHEHGELATAALKKAKQAGTLTKT